MKISRAFNVTSTLCKVKKKIVKLGIKTAQKEIMSFFIWNDRIFQGVKASAGKTGLCFVPKGNRLANRIGEDMPEASAKEPDTISFYWKI